MFQFIFHREFRPSTERGKVARPCCPRNKRCVRDRDWTGEGVRRELHKRHEPSGVAYSPNLRPPGSYTHVHTSCVSSRELIWTIMHAGVIVYTLYTYAVHEFRGLSVVSG